MKTVNRTYWVILEMTGGTRFRSERSYSEERAGEMVDRLRAEGIGGAYMTLAYITVTETPDTNGTTRGDK